MVESSATVTPEQALLIDALQDRLHGTPSPISREPFGSGVIAGFRACEYIDSTGEPVLAGAATSEATRVETHWYVDTSGDAVENETGLVMQNDDGSVGARIWLHPADPRLPALAPVSFEDSARALLARVNMPLDGLPEIVAYRPGKRAVFRAYSDGTEVYVKVLRPRDVEALVEVHHRMQQAGLDVPSVLAWSPEGLMVLPRARGTELGKVLADTSLNAHEVLDQIDAVRDRLARVDLGRYARTSLTERAEWYFTRLGSAVDRCGDDALRNELLERVAFIRERAHEASTRLASLVPPTTIHGDLHVGQLFWSDERISTVLDVDTAGIGNPADDSGACIAHLLMSAAANRAREAHAHRLRELASAAWERWSSPDGDLARVLAVHLAGHALAPAERGDFEQVLTVLDPALMPEGFVRTLSSS